MQTITLNANQVNAICEKIGETLIDFSLLGSGNHNLNYTIQTHRDKYVLRVENNVQFKNLANEYRILSSLPPGLGPQVYLFDDSHQLIERDYLLEEFIEGQYPSEPLTEDFITAMANWFRQLHMIKAPIPLDDFPKGYYSLVNGLRPYHKNFEKYHYVIDTVDALHNDLIDVFAYMQTFCQQHDTLFKDREKFSLLHHDTSRENILINGQVLKVIDWEFAGFGLPEWDLVYFLQSYPFDSTEQQLFLAKYGYTQTPRSQTQLNSIGMLNLCGGIGYSLWRLDLITKGQVAVQERSATLQRLKSGVPLLQTLIRESMSTKSEGS